MARRTQFANPDDHIILDDVLSKEPLGPVAPLGDDAWFNVIKWVVYATIEAEELGIDSTNVAETRRRATTLSSSASWASRRRRGSVRAPASASRPTGSST